MSLIKMLLVLILCCIVVWGAWAVIGAFGIVEPWRTVVQVLVVLFVAVWGYTQFGGPSPV